MELTVDFSSSEDKKQLYRVLQSRKPRRYKITITEERDTRTLQQNKYYWGVVLPIISQETGYTTDESHDVLRRMFLYKDITNRKTGQVDRVPDSTALQDTKRFADYVDKIISWALQELDCFIPEPGKSIFTDVNE